MQGDVESTGLCAGSTTRTRRERVTEGFSDTASKVVSDSDLERWLKNQLREPSKEPDRK